MKSGASPKKQRTSKKKKIGIFGGSFNPLHIGHINSIVTVAETLGLSKVLVVPTYQSPGKSFIDQLTPEQRLEMTERGLEDYSEIAEVLDLEIRREGNSYTIDTLNELLRKYDSEQLYLCMGVDLLQRLHTWKNFEEILEKTNIVVTSRPGAVLPLREEDLPLELQSYVNSIDKKAAQLKTGRTVHFVPLDDMNISATNIRKSVRSGLHIDKFVNFPVQEYIQTHGLYLGSGVKITDYREFTLVCGRILWNKKAIGVNGYDLTKITAPCDYAIICSGTSTRHAGALAEAVVEEVKRVYGVAPQSREGMEQGQWVLLDYGGLIIHIFYDFVRGQYDLEKIWNGFTPLTIADTSTEPQRPILSAQG